MKVLNLLEVQGEHYNEIYDSLVTGKEGTVDFNTVLPEPEELRIQEKNSIDIERHTIRARHLFKNMPYLHSSTCDQRKKYVEDNFDKFLELDSQLILYIQNIIKYGYASLHDWRLKNWGTSDNALFDNNTEFRSYNETMSRLRLGRPNSHGLTFVTRQHPPLPVINKLSEYFTKVTFHLFFVIFEEMITLLPENTKPSKKEHTHYIYVQGKQYRYNVCNKPTTWGKI